MQNTYLYNLDISETCSQTDNKVCVRERERERKKGKRESVCIGISGSKRMIK